MSDRISLRQFHCPRTAHLGLFAHLSKTVMLRRLPQEATGFVWNTNMAAVSSF